MTTRRALLRGLPFLFGGLLIFFAIVPQVFQYQEQRFQAIRQKGWTTYLQEFRLDESLGSPGARNGDITLDTSGRIWLAGGGEGLAGLHVFDGTEWISHDGRYWDLAPGLQGEIWAVPVYPGTVDVFDGRQWRTYEGRDLGINRILQVEIDSNGRIWVVTDDFGVEQVAEIIIQQDRAIARVSHPEFTITGGQIKSIDADDQGRIWAAVWRFTRPDATEEWAGLNVFDGKTWQRVPDQGMDLQHVVRTTFDDQGRAWVATECGGVMTYDGKDWVAIVDEDTTSNFCRSIDGITLDHQGRVWTWGYNSLQLLDGSRWITLTPEDSGIVDGGVFGLVVDDLDRVWVGSSGGVSMATVQDALSRPEKIVNQHRMLLFLKKWMNGTNWFLPSILAILWLAVYLNMLPGVLLALIVGVFATVLFGPPLLIDIGSGHSLLNPGVITTFGGAFGGLVGGQIDKMRSLRSNSKTRWKFILAITGLVVGSGLGILQLILTGMVLDLL